MVRLNKQKFKEDYLAGVYIRDLAKKYSLSYTEVYYLIGKLGLPRRGKKMRFKQLPLPHTVVIIYRREERMKKPKYVKSISTMVMPREVIRWLRSREEREARKK